LPERRVAVLGCGNLLMRDDGLGVRAVEQLRRCGVPEGVELTDAGTALIDVLPHVDGAEKTILVDVVRAGGQPGDIYRIPTEELEQRLSSAGPKCSLHDIELREALTLARLQQARLGTVILIGMEPAAIEMGMELSEAVERAMPRLLEAILAEIRRPAE